MFAFSSGASDGLKNLIWFCLTHVSLKINLIINTLASKTIEIFMGFLFFLSFFFFSYFCPKVTPGNDGFCHHYKKGHHNDI